MNVHPGVNSLQDYALLAAWRELCIYFSRGVEGEKRLIFIQSDYSVKVDYLAVVRG